MVAEATDLSSRIFSLGAYGLVGIAIFMSIAWLVSLKLKDASIVDRLWGLNFILLAGLYFLQTNEIYWRHYLAIVLLAIWGGRLSLHIHLRNRGHGEDYRYQAMRQKQGASFWWQSLFSVFLLQGLLAFLISAPILLIFSSDAKSFGLLDFLGLLFWCVGFYFEAVGDLQLKKFKADPQNKGKVLNQGLWALTRHPNYFGDAMIWWGLFLLAASLPYGWLSFFGPLIMSLFLRYVSGVSLLEKSLRERKPEYLAYMNSTPAFIPKLSKIGRLFSSRRAKKLL